MTNRRQFIQSGLALTAVSSSVLAVLPAGVGATGNAEALRLERFVFDNRFAVAVEIAQQVARQGIPLAETSGDLTDLWYDYLEPRWKTAPEALAGVTTRYGLFVLETLAADHRMRVVYRAEHAAAQHERIAHEPIFSWIIAPRSTVAPTIQGDGIWRYCRPV